ncbi:type II toxin-antitoxin system HicA family toxin [Candidatus Pacearchaeota archaeon]|nr:type II toxin-antitoxin system HicA family toxin [Candidatus Pacearchaeota archaeon]
MKLPQISGLNLIKILRKFGFVIVRQRGSHVRLEKKINEDILKLTVPMHDKLKKGTLSRIIKDSMINVEEFERFL